jgi:hypothetical protein
VVCREGSTHVGDVELTNQSAVEELAGVRRVEGSIHVTGEVTDLGRLECF